MVLTGNSQNTEIISSARPGPLQTSALSCHFCTIPPPQRSLLFWLITENLEWNSWTGYCMTSVVPVISVVFFVAILWRSFYTQNNGTYSDLPLQFLRMDWENQKHGLAFREHVKLLRCLVISFIYWRHHFFLFCSILPGRCLFPVYHSIVPLFFSPLFTSAPSIYRVTLPTPFPLVIFLSTKWVISVVKKRPQRSRKWRISLQKWSHKFGNINAKFNFQTSSSRNWFGSCHEWRDWVKARGLRDRNLYSQRTVRQTLCYCSAKLWISWLVMRFFHYA
jgi:hypothetical protein